MFSCLYSTQDRYDEAEQRHMEALARTRRVHGTEKDHPDIHLYINLYVMRAVGKGSSILLLYETMYIDESCYTP